MAPAINNSTVVAVDLNLTHFVIVHDGLHCCCFFVLFTFVCSFNERRIHGQRLSSSSMFAHAVHAVLNLVHRPLESCCCRCCCIQMTTPKSWASLSCWKTRRAIHSSSLRRGSRLGQGRFMLLVSQQPSTKGGGTYNCA
jgi:hypothetical protein